MKITNKQLNRCHKFRDKLSAFAAGELNPSEMEQVQEHIRSCPACSAEAEQYRSALTLLRDAPQAPPPGDLYPSFAARLAREDKALDVKRMRLRWASAAVCLLIVGYGARSLEDMWTGSHRNMQQAGIQRYSQSNPSASTSREIAISSLPDNLKKKIAEQASLGTKDEGSASAAPPEHARRRTRLTRIQIAEMTSEDHMLQKEALPVTGTAAVKSPGSVSQENSGALQKMAVAGIAPSELGIDQVKSAVKSMQPQALSEKTLGFEGAALSAANPQENSASKINDGMVMNNNAGMVHPDAALPAGDAINGSRMDVIAAPIMKAFKMVQSLNDENRTSVNYGSNASSLKNSSRVSELNEKVRIGSRETLLQGKITRDSEGNLASIHVVLETEPMKNAEK
jgi:hypothetical protein